MALTTKIACNGVKPSKNEIYTLAAELVESQNIFRFKSAIIESLKSYDYDYGYGYDYGYDYDYDYNYGYNYDYGYDYGYDHEYDYDYVDARKKKKNNNKKK